MFYSLFTYIVQARSILTAVQPA